MTRGAKLRIDRSAGIYNLTATMRKLFSLFGLLAVTSTAAAQDEAGAIRGAAGYSLRPGDILDVTVWQQPNYSGQFKVDETGTIRYPVIGEISVLGRTVAEVRAALVDGLGQIFNAPFVTVTPQFNIAVLGEVRDPGLYTVDLTSTVLDVVASAGGPSPTGNINKIRLLRAGRDIRLRLADDRVGGLSLQAVGLRSGDQIVVARRGFTGGDLRTLLAVLQLGVSVAILITR